MGYESEPPPSYPKLRKCSDPVILITPLPRLFLWIIYRVLIPPAHHPARPRHPIRLRAQCMYRPSGHPLRYGRLPTLNVHSNGVETCRVHRLLYRWILTLFSCPTFSRNFCDLLQLPMVKRRQDLDHLPGHHPNLSSIE